MFQVFFTVNFEHAWPNHLVILQLLHCTPMFHFFLCPSPPPPPKTLENRFSGVFRGHRNGTLTWNVLNENGQLWKLVLEKCFNMIALDLSSIQVLLQRENLLQMNVVMSTGVYLRPIKHLRWSSLVKIMNYF